jgi:cation:H+ antiporter
MLLAILAIILGLVVLVWSSDKFVDGAAAIAESAGISKLMVGLTIVAFGTSAPEILVSAFASFTGAAGLAVGNALGSNIANIGLVLGVTALVVSIPVHKLTAKQDLPVYLIVALVAGWVLHDSTLDLIDSLVLLGGLCTVTFLVIRYRSKVKDPVLIEELTEEAEEHFSDTNKAYTAFIVGLVLLLLSSRALVWGAVQVADAFGIDEVIIGLTIVAIGTSLPELAATLTSALKNHHDLAIGNVMGSNVLNLLAVLPLPGLIASNGLPEQVFQRDYAMMLLLSLMMAVFMFVPSTNASISRLKGGLLLATYLAYLFSLTRAVA